MNTLHIMPIKIYETFKQAPIVIAQKPFMLVDSAIIHKKQLILVKYDVSDVQNSQQVIFPYITPQNLELLRQNIMSNFILFLGNMTDPIKLTYDVMDNFFVITILNMKYYMAEQELQILNETHSKFIIYVK